MNILLYEVRRRVRGGLRLANIRVSVESSVEAVQGFGAPNIRTFSLVHSELNRAFGEYFESRFPCGMNELSRSVAGSVRFMVHEFLEMAATEINSLFKEIYRSECIPKFDETGNPPLGLDRTCFLCAVENRVGADTRYLKPSDHFVFGFQIRSTLEPPAVLANESLSKIVFGGSPLRARTYSYPLPGALYMDSQIGHLPALEPYYEKIRQQEVMSKLVSNFQNFSTAQKTEIEWQNLIGRQLLGGDITVSSVGIRKASVSLTGSLRNIVLDFTAAIPILGRWEIYCRSSKLIDIQVSTANTLSFRFSTDDETVPTDEAKLLQSITALIRSGSNVTVVSANGLSPFLSGRSFPDILGCCQEKE